MGFGSDRAEQNLKSSVSSCKNFQPNIFNKTKCQNCFRTREAHQLDNDGDNQKSKKVLICGYLFVAPGLDVNNPSSRTRKWQRRFFVFYESGDLCYALDESPSTIPQGTINMYECTDVFNADDKTGHSYSMGIVVPDNTTYIRAEVKEEKDRWFSVLSEYPQINRAAAKSKSKKRERELQQPQPPAQTVPQVQSKTIQRDEPSNRSTSSDRSKARDRRPISVDRLGDVFAHTQRSIYDKDSPRRSSSQSSKIIDTKDKNKNYEMDKESPTSKRTASDSSVSSISSTDSRGGIGYDQKPEQPRFHGAKKQYETISDVPRAKLQTGYQSQQPNTKRRPSTEKTGMKRELAESHDLFPSLKEQFENPETLKSGSLDSMRYLRGEPYASRWYSHKDEPLADIFSGIDNYASQEKTERPAKVSPLESTPSNTVHLPTSRSDYDSAVHDDSAKSESKTYKEPERMASGLKGTDGTILAPSKRNIERRRHQQQRRNRHTLDVSMITPTKDVVEEKSDEQTEEQPEPRKRANSDPNVMEDITKLRSRSYVGFGDIIHLKKGWLIKRESEKDWAKHWFVLSDNTLKYYRDSRAEEADKEDDCIYLSTCQDVKELDVSRNYGFQIQLSDSQPIVLAAMTNGIRNNWIQAIKKAKAALPPSTRTSPDPADVKVGRKLEEQQAASSDSSGDEVDSAKQEIKTSEPPPTSASPSIAIDAEESEKSAPVPSRKLLPDVDYMLGKKADLDQSTPAKKLAKEEGHRHKGSPIKFEGNPAYLTRLEAIKSPPSKQMSPPKKTTPKSAPSVEPGKSDRTRSSQVSMETDEGESSGSEEEGETDSELEDDYDSALDGEVDTPASKETKIEPEKEDIHSAGKTKDSSENKESGDSDGSTSVSEGSDIDDEPDEFQLRHSHDQIRDTGGNITSSSGEAMLVELLEAEVESLKAQLEKTQQELVEAHQQNIELKTQMTTARRDHRESISELDIDQHTFMTQIEDMNVHQDQIAQRNQELQVELKESKNASEIRQQQLTQLKRKLGEANQTINKQENAIQQLKTKLDIAVSELSETDQTAHKLRIDLKIEKSKTEALAEVLSEKNEKLESQIIDLKNALKTAEAELSAREKLTSDLERSQQRQDSDVKIEHLSAKLEEARQRLKDSEEDLVKNEERFEKRYSRLQSKAQAEREAMEEKLNLADEKIAQLIEEKALKEQKARTESEKLDEEWQEQEDKIEELLHQLKTEMTVKSKLQEKLDEAETKLAELTLSLQGDSLDVSMPAPKTDLDKRLEESEKKLTQALHDVQAEKDANIHLQEELKQMKAKLNALQKQNDDLKGRSSDEDTGKEKIRNLRKKLDEAIADKAVAEEYLEKSTWEIRDLKAALQEESAKTEQLIDELQQQQHRSEQDTKSSEPMSSCDEASNLRTQVQQLQEEQEKLKQQLDASLKDVEKLKLELEDKTVELEEINSRLQEKIDENKRLRTDLEKCHTHKGSIQEQILQQTVEISQLRRQLQQVKSTSQEQEKKLTDKIPEVDELRETVATLEKEIDGLRERHQEEMTNKSRELEELRKTLAESERKVDDAERRLLEERHRISSLENVTSKDDTENETDSVETTKQLKTKYENALQEIKKLRADLREANNTYDDLELQYLQIKEENRRAKANFDEQMDLMSNRIQDLTTKLASSDRKLRESEKRVVVMERKVGTGGYNVSRAPSRELESKLEELELKLVDVEGTLKAQEEETDSLKGIIVSVEEKVASREEMVQSSVEPPIDSQQENKNQSIPTIVATNSSSSKVEMTTSQKPSTESTGSESDDSDSSVPREKTENPKQRRLMRMKSLESKLSDTEQKLKQVTAKLVDVTTKELDNRKQYHAKCVSENKLKEQVKDSKAKLETMSKQLEQEHSLRVRIVGEVSNQFSELELKLASIESNIEDAKLKISDFLQEVHRYKASYDKHAVDHFSYALNEVEKHVQETKDTLIKAEKALGSQEVELAEKENTEISRKKSALRKSSLESLSSEASISKSEISLKSVDDAVNSTIDLLRDQLLQADERLQEKESEMVAQENAVRSERIDLFADKLAFEAVKLGQVTYVFQQLRERSNQQITVKLEVPEEEEKKDEVRPSSPVEEFAETLSNRILMQGSLGATLSRFRSQDVNSVDQSSDNDEESEVDGGASPSRRNVAPRRVSEPLPGSVQSDDDATHVGEFASTLAEQALKEGEMTYVIETKVKDLQQQLREAYKRLEHQQVRLKKLTTLCDEGKVDEMRQLASEEMSQESVARMINRPELQFPQVDNVPLMSATEVAGQSSFSEDVTLDDNPELAPYAKQIEIEETRRFASDYASGEIVRAEMIRILQRVMDMYEKEINMERVSCMQMLKVQRQAAERKYAGIEHSIREEMSLVIGEIKDRYEAELEKLRQKGRQEQQNEKGVGPLYNDQLMNKFIEIVARRAVLSNHMTLWVDKERSVQSDIKPQHRRHSLSALTTNNSTGDSMLVYPERLLAKCSSMDDYAELLAQKAIFQAELMYIVNKLQSEQKEQLQALHEAYEKISNGKVIETITMEHARNIGSVRERYESIIREEREEQTKVMKKFQEELDRTKSELGNLLKEMKEKEQFSQKTGNPEIQFTLEDDLNDQVEEMTARRVKHLTEQLDSVQEQLKKSQETLKLKSEEHIKEVDTITDVMEHLKGKHETEFKDMKERHVEEMEAVSHEHDENMVRMTEAHQKERKDLQGKYEEELDKIVEEYNLKVRELKESIDNSREEEIRLLKQRHEEEMQQVNDECEQRITDASIEIADIQQEEINQLKSQHEEMMAKGKEQYEQKLNNIRTEMLDLKEQHDNECKDLQDKHDNSLHQKEREMAVLKQQYEDQLAEVQGGHEQRLKKLNSEYLDFKEMHESEVKELQEKCRELEMSHQLQETVEQLKEQQEEDLRCMGEECERKLKEAESHMLDLKELHESEVKELQEKQEEELVKIERNYEEKLKDIEEDMSHLEEDHQKQIIEMKRRYDVDIGRLRKEIEDRSSGDTSEPCSPQLKSPSEQKIANVRREYEQRLSKVKVENEKKMSHIQQNYEDEIAKLRKTQEKKVKQMEQRHDEHVIRMKKDQERHESELDKRSRREFDRIRDEHRYRIAETEQKYEDAIKRIKQNHSEEFSSLREKHGREIDNLKTEYEEKLDNFAELHENDLQAVKMAQMVNNVQPQEPLLQAESMPQQQAQLPQQSLVTALREKYEKGLEQLAGGDNVILMKAHQVHRDAVERLRRRDQEEIEKLKQDRDKRFAEETEATLLALKSANKRHEEELERGRARVRPQGNGDIDETIEAMRREHQHGISFHAHTRLIAWSMLQKIEELERIENEMVALSEQYASKCMESANMEEQLAMLQRCLEEKKQSIQHLSAENTHLNEKMAEEIAMLRGTLGHGEDDAEQGAGADILELYEVKINLRIKESETQALQEEIEQLKMHLEQTKKEENELFAEKYKKLKQEHDGTEEKVRYLERKLNEAYDKLKDVDVRKTLAPNTFETKTKQPSKSNLDRERSYSESNLSSDFPGTTKWYSEENLRRPSPDIRLGTFIPMETKKTSSKAKSASLPAAYSSKSSPKKTDRTGKKPTYKTPEKSTSVRKKEKVERDKKP
ncbi:LOW QUALITY PROTEIN: golgin subfamily A member 4-like [Ptychodera flava]|uniref:LOW QUALITY PROTEIN: golgin subfamily A member 4-like n=1 Tax=Ptychodera flava TaxID=63121 RepID=UPI003969D045